MVMVIGNVTSFTKLSVGSISVKITSSLKNADSLDLSEHQNSFLAMYLLLKKVPVVMMASGSGIIAYGSEGIISTIAV